MSQSNWDRIGQIEITLGPISKERGQEMLWARLQQFREGTRGIHEIEALISTDKLFPLSSDWFERQFMDTPGIRPRELINLASECWQSHQEILTTTPGLIWLERLKEEMRKKNRSLCAEKKNTTIDSSDTRVSHNRRPPNRPPSPPPLQETLRSLIVLLVENCHESGEHSALQAVASFATDTDSMNSPFDLIVGKCRSDGDRYLVGVRTLVTDEAGLATSRIDALLENTNSVDQVLLVTDVRQPLPLGPDGRKKLDSLLALGVSRFEHIALTADEHAELEDLLALQESVKKFVADKTSIVLNDDNTPLPIPRTSPHFYQSIRLMQRLVCARDEVSDETVTL